MTIRDALKKYHNIEIELLLASLLKKSKEFLFSHAQTRLSRAQSKRLAALARQRRTGKPMAYILGYKAFYGLRLTVNESVLIPRPESEWLVERGYEEIKKRKLKTILDLGTGSGCVIIALAKLLGPGDRQVIGTDLSPAALRVARKNARAHKVRVIFLQSDLFSKLPQHFDCIIANLPYVRKSQLQKLHSSLRYEPKKALSDGSDTWILQQKFFAQLPQHTTDQAVILLEIDPGSKSLINDLVKCHLSNYRVLFHKDLCNLWRYATIVPKSNQTL